MPFPCSQFLNGSPNLLKTKYTIPPMAHEAPHELCPGCLSHITLLVSLLLTCSMPSSFQTQGLCTCFSQLEAFFYHSCPLEGWDSLRCHMLRRPSLTTTRQTSSTSAPGYPYGFFKALVPMRHHLVHFPFTCLFSGSPI